MQRVVSVWTRWGDYVLGVRDVRPGESLSLGAAPLLRVGRGGASVFAGPGGAERELQVGESVTVTVGELSYTLCCAEAEEAEVWGPARRRWALLDASVVGALVAASAWWGALAPRAPSSGLAALAELGPMVSPEPALSQPAREAVFAVVAEPAAALLRLPGDMRCGRAEMGADFETRGRYGVAGPADNADPHLARPEPGQGYPTARGALAELMRPQAQPGSSGPTAPFGRDAALGTEAGNALGNLWGDELNDARGERGLGLAGRPGGGVKHFDVAPLAEGRPARLRVVHTGLRVTGARKTSEIGRVMAARFGDFQACGASVEPAALHDVELGFDVDQTGHAVASGAGAGALEQCLDWSLAGAAFAPGASEVSHVVYPLHFVAADVELKGPPAVPASKAAPCDCGGW